MSRIFLFIFFFFTTIFALREYFIVYHLHTFNDVLIVHFNYFQYFL